MKRLVIHSKTGHFLKMDGNWTSAESEAAIFNHISTLMQTCTKHHVKDAKILLRFENSQHPDTLLPLP